MWLNPQIKGIKQYVFYCLGMGLFHRDMCYSDDGSHNRGPLGLFRLMVNHSDDLGGSPAWETTICSSNVEFFPNGLVPKTHEKAPTSWVQHNHGQLPEVAELSPGAPYNHAYIQQLLGTLSSPSVEESQPLKRLISWIQSRGRRWTPDGSIGEGSPEISIRFNQLAFVVIGLPCSACCLALMVDGRVGHESSWMFEKQLTCGCFLWLSWS